MCYFPLNHDYGRKGIHELHCFIVCLGVPVIRHWTDGWLIQRLFQRLGHRMPEMLVLSKYQDVFGHPKWCRIFSINSLFAGIHLVHTSLLILHTFFFSVTSCCLIYPILNSDNVLPRHDLNLHIGLIRISAVYLDSKASQLSKPWSLSVGEFCVPNESSGTDASMASHVGNVQKRRGIGKNGLEHDICEQPKSSMDQTRIPTEKKHHPSPVYLFGEAKKNPNQRRKKTNDHRALQTVLWMPNRKYVHLDDRTRRMKPSELGLALCHAYMLIDPEHLGGCCFRRLGGSGKGGTGGSGVRKQVQGVFFFFIFWSCGASGPWT